jgi:transposase-like protein
MSADATSKIGTTGSATVCPLCHTDGPGLDAGQLRTGATWRCERCGQSWDLTRLRAVESYNTYCAGRMAPGVH